MSDVFDHNLDGDIEITIEDDPYTTDEIVAALSQNPSGLLLLAQAIRLMETRQSRGLGNLYSTKAQREPRPKFVQPNTTQRIY